MSYRLTLDLPEETRARWQAAAERIDYQRLDGWAHDTLDTAADPDAGQVVDLRARLTTAETERNQAELDLKHAAESDEHWHDRFRAAEASVEAAHTVLRIANDALGYAFLPEKYEQIETARALIRAHFAAQTNLTHVVGAAALPTIARAALACPPQQPQKAGE